MQRVKNYEVSNYIPEKQKKGRRNWQGKPAEQQAVYENRRRVRNEYGKSLLRRRGELVERSFAHCYETGGMRRCHLHGRDNILKIDHRIYITHMNETIAVGSRHIVVDLRDNVAGALGGCKRGIYPDTKTAKTVRVGRRNFGQSNCNRHRAALEQFLDFAQINWCVVGAAFVDCFPDVGADEDCIVAEVACHFWRNVGSH